MLYYMAAGNHVCGFFMGEIRRWIMRANRPRDKLSQKERIREITEQLEAGVQAAKRRHTGMDTSGSSALRK